MGSSLGRARGVETLGKFLTPVCLCSPSSKVGTGQRAVMPCGWGVMSALTVRHNEALYKSTFTLLYFTVDKEELIKFWKPAASGSGLQEALYYVMHHNPHSSVLTWFCQFQFRINDHRRRCRACSVGHSTGSPLPIALLEV